MSIFDLMFNPQDNRVGMVPPMQPRPGAQPMPSPAPQPAPQPTPQQPGLLSRLGSGFVDYLSDPINRKQLAIGFNAMRLNPDANFARSLQSQIENAQAIKLLTAQGNRTVQALRAAAASEKNSVRKVQLENAANLVEKDPSYAPDAAKLLFGSGVSRKAFAPVTDPVSGTMSIPTYDPNTGEVGFQEIPGARAETKAEAAQRESDLRIKEADIQEAKNAGARVFGSMQNLDDQISKLYEARQALMKGGQSGIFRQYLPAFDAATAELRAIGNSLGIDIINSATFGALSAAELNLALQTGLPLSLNDAELTSYIESKIKAQTKLRNALLEEARKLSSGNTRYSTYIQQYAPKGGAEPIFEPQAADLVQSGDVAPPKQGATKIYNPNTGKIEDVPNA